MERSIISAMDKSLATQADRLLRAAYPDKRERARAIRWLGWIAYRVDGRPQFTWQDIPAFYRNSESRGNPPLPSVARVLADAVKRGVLRKNGRKYQFADPSLSACLSALYKASRSGPLWEMISFLAAGHRVRIGVDAVLCWAIVAGALVWPLARMPAPWWLSSFLAELAVEALGIVIVGLGLAAIGLVTSRIAKPMSQGVFWITFIAWILGLTIAVVAQPNTASYKLESEIVAISGLFVLGVPAAAVGAAWSLAGGSPNWTRTDRWFAVAIVTCVTGVVIAWAGLSRAVPAAFVAACGVLVVALIIRAAARVRPGWRRKLLAPFPDIAAVATASAAFLVLSVGNLLTSDSAAGLLFPLAVWGSVQAWRKMLASTRLTRRAGADLTLASLLGITLALFLAWLANILGMSRPEMAVLLVVLGHAGEAVDLPWWSWTALYVLLAGLYLAIARWPVRLAAVMRRLKRLRAVPTANMTRRALTCVHFGLLFIALVGLSARVTVTTTFRSQLKAVYAVAVQRQFEATGELDAYWQIRRQFKPGSANSAPVLMTLIKDVDEGSTESASSGGSENDEATQKALSAARALGQLQAAALRQAAGTSLPVAEQDAERDAGFDSPIRNASDAEDRIDKVDTEEQEDDTKSAAAKAAGEAAASAVASTLGIPQLSSEFQILQEYLSGLVEDSPLKDQFAAWLENLPGAEAPPDADTMVDPDPEQLKQTAVAELKGELTADGDTAALTAAENEQPLEAAIGLVEEEQSLPIDIGDCTACTPSEEPGQQPGDDEPGDDGPGGSDDDG